MRHRTPPLLALVYLAMTTAIVGCGALPFQVSTALPSPAITQPPTITSAPPPTRTPGPPIVLAVVPTDLDAAQAKQAKAQLGDLAQSSGMLFQTQPTLQTAEVPPDLAYLILLTSVSNADLTAIWAQVPTARIIALAADGLSSQPNLALLQVPGDAKLQQAFLAGYTAALITDDYRVATLTAVESKDGLAQADAFRNGAEYYCGLCRPVRPPYENYPLSLPYGSSSGPVASVLSGTGVQTVFVPAALSDAQTLTDLVDSGMTLLGSIPSPPELKQSWAASFQPSPVAAIQAAWSSLTSESPPSAVSIPITVQDVNADLLSPGRLRLVVQTQADLAAGFIDPASGQ